MLCNHDSCRELRRLGTFTGCNGLSRRLREVPAYVSRETARWLSRAERLRLADVEHDASLFTLILNMLRVGADQLRIKTAQYGTIPYRMAIADCVRGCKELALLISAKPLDQFRPIAQTYIRRYGVMIQQVVRRLRDYSHLAQSFVNTFPHLVCASDRSLIRTLDRVHRHMQTTCKVSGLCWYHPLVLEAV